MKKITGYYQGLTDEQIARNREEVIRRWGEMALAESEERITKMGKKEFDDLQAAGSKIFQTISDYMSQGYDSEFVQACVIEWRQWLENFYHYSDEAVAGLGREYSRNPGFVKFFRKYHQDLPEFLTKAISYWYTPKE